MEPERNRWLTVNRALVVALLAAQQHLVWLLWLVSPDQHEVVRLVGDGPASLGVVLVWDSPLAAGWFFAVVNDVNVDAVVLGDGGGLVDKGLLAVVVVLTLHALCEVVDDDV